MKKYKDLSYREIINAVLVSYVFSFLGGFIMAEYYRRKGKPEKAIALKVFFILGIGLQLMTFFALNLWLLHEDAKPQTPRELTQQDLEVIEQIAPNVEDYLTSEQIEEFSDR